MTFFAGNAQHIGARPEQQDAFAFSDPNDRGFVVHAGLLGVVADGMGGMSRGSEASRAAVRAFLHAYEAKVPAEPVPDALRRSLDIANGAVLSLNHSGTEEDGAGTTLVAAVLHRDGLHWIGVGDSRLYLLRSGRLTRVTMDHVFARRLEQRVAQGTLTKLDVERHPDRANLTSYLGARELPEVDCSLRPVRLAPGDRVILCTDGLYRAVAEDELASAFTRDARCGCDVVTRLALKKHRTGQDNLTVIALSQEPPTAPRRFAIGRRRGYGRVAAVAVWLALAAISVTAYARRDLVTAGWSRVRASIGLAPAAKPAGRPAA